VTVSASPRPLSEPDDGPSEQSDHRKEQEQLRHSERHCAGRLANVEIVSSGVVAHYLFNLVKGDAAKGPALR
jgi:hypothetical protein